MASSTAVQTSNQYSDNVTPEGRGNPPRAHLFPPNAIVPGWYDPFEFTRPSPNMPVSTLTITYGNGQTETFDIVCYDQTWDTNGSKRISVQAVPRSFSSSVSVKFTNNVDVHHYGKIAEPESAQINNIRGLDPWVPSGRELDECIRDLGCTASKDMARKPRPRYGWHG